MYAKEGAESRTSNEFGEAVVVPMTFSKIIRTWIGAYLEVGFVSNPLVLGDDLLGVVVNPALVPMLNVGAIGGSRKHLQPGKSEEVT